MIDFLNALAKNAGFATDVQTAQSTGVCIRCGKMPASFPTNADEREFAISRICPTCFALLFAEDEDEQYEPAPTRVDAGCSCCDL